MAELGDFLVTGDSKVHVDVEMLDYGYIEKCTDPEKLKAIVDLLKSGKEGYYPDLTAKAEQKLLSILPAKERTQILRMKTQVTPGEIQEASIELDAWQNSVEAVDHALRSKGSPPKRGRALPPVRGTTREKLDVPQVKSSSASGGSIELKENASKTERLSGYNFPAWEKFDVDGAIADMDAEEDAAEKQKRLAREDGRRRAEELARKRALRHQQELDVFRESMKSHEMTDLQKKNRAGREKQKGNEAFRAGENDEAYAFYSRSLALDDTNATVYTNRAVLGIKMNKLETAVEDASRAIALDPKYMKAYYRRGVARLKLGQTGEAIEDFIAALKQDPGNKELSVLLKKAKDKFLEVEGREYGTDPHQSVVNAKKEDITTVVAVRVVGSADALLLPKSHKNVVVSGVVQEVESAGGDDEDGGFTRIQIQDTDSEEEEEEEEEGVTETEGGEEGEREERFTRIAITTSDDDEEEDEGDAAEEKFTRIAISMDSDSESEEEEKDDDSQKKLEEAVALKNEGNALMQKGDLQGAVKAYTSSLELVAEGDNSTAVHCNRSLTHIKLKNYSDAILDAVIVLSRDPRNLKALYRRSMAYEGINDLPSALADLDSLLEISPDNGAALEARARIGKIQAEAVASKEDNAEWEVETRRKEALSHIQNGDGAKAVMVLEEALALAKGGDVEQQAVLSLLHLLATSYASVGNEEKSLGVYSDILKMDAQNHKAAVKSAEAHMRQGDLDQAKRFAGMALRLDPMDAEARMLMDSIERANEKLYPPESGAPQAVSPSKRENGSVDESESIKRKNAGNEAMKANDYLLAIQLYTEAIDLDSSNMMFYNNRAQAYLKVSKFVEAEADSTVVIDSNKRLPNLKALFRRALARKGLKTKQSLASAQEDLSVILQAEPSNKEAAKEKLRVQALLEQATKEEEAKIAKMASASVSIIPEENPTDGLVARSTRIKTPAKSDTESKSSTPSSPEKVSATSSPARTTSANGPSPSSGSKRVAAKRVVVQNPNVPSDPPKTVYELERVWRGLKNRPELFANYLKIFKKSTFKKVIKEAVSPDLVSSMLVSVRDHLVSSDPTVAFNVLEGLTQTPNFGMTVSLLPAADIDCVKASIDHLTAHVDSTKGAKLKELYKV